MIYFREKDREVRVKTEEIDHSILSPKVQINNHFVMQKENNGLSNHAREAFLSSYKSGRSKISNAFDTKKIYFSGFSYQKRIKITERGFLSREKHGKRR